MLLTGTTPTERANQLATLTREQLVSLLLESETEKAHLIGALKDSYVLMMSQRERAQALEAQGAHREAA
jgi:hypothetical protein